MNTHIKRTNLIRQNKSSYGPQFETHLLEQYKLYVEMADRISARRINANSFFVGIHTALIAALTVLIKEKILLPTLLGLTPFYVVILLCYIWWRIIKSYRQLNSGKFLVIHELEQLLPVAPYDEEWNLLGEGKNSSLYLPFTHVENFVPLCFVILYILLASNLIFYQ